MRCVRFIEQGLNLVLIYFCGLNELYSYTTAILLTWFKTVEDKTYLIGKLILHNVRINRTSMSSIYDSSFSGLGFNPNRLGFQLSDLIHLIMDCNINLGLELFH